MILFLLRWWLLQVLDSGSYCTGGQGPLDILCKNTTLCIWDLEWDWVLYKAILGCVPPVFVLLLSSSLIVVANRFCYPLIDLSGVLSSHCHNMIREG